MQYVTAACSHVPGLQKLPSFAEAARAASMTEAAIEAASNLDGLVDQLKALSADGALFPRVS